MALEYKDRVKDQTNSTGTGSLTIDGVAPAGYRTIASAHTTGATIRYSIVNADGTQWEVGEGVWTSATNTLTRDTIYASSNAGLAVNLAAGAKALFTGPVAADLGDYSRDLNFVGSGLRIKGDFSSNATIANRLMFQSSTLNGATLVSAIPNGTGNTARWIAYNSSDPANSAAAALSALSTDIRLASTNNGTGTLLPLTFFMGGTTEAARISIASNFLIGTTTDDGSNKLQVAGNVTAGRYTSTQLGSSFLAVTATDSRISSQFQNQNGVLYVGRDAAAGGFFGIADASVVWSIGAGSPLVFGVNSGEAARFNPNTRNFLIGGTTDNATDKLQVTGSSYFSGNLSIGGQTFGQKLHVEATGSTDTRVVSIGRTGSGIAMTLGYYATAGTPTAAVVRAQNTLALAFEVMNAEAMRLAPTTSNLLVGTTTDNGTDKLQVAGKIKSTTGGFVFPDGTTQTTAASGGGSIAVSDEGTQVAASAASFNFVGAGVTSSAVGGAVTVTIPANVVGPASATDSRIALFDGTTGKLLKNFTSGLAYLTSDGEAYITAIGQLQARYSFTLNNADTTGLVLNSGTAGNSVTFKPPSSGGNSTFTLPAGYGTNGQALITNGAGVMSWGTISGGAGGTNTVIDGGFPDSSYAAITPIDGGTP